MKSHYREQSSIYPYKRSTTIGTKKKLFSRKTGVHYNITLIGEIINQPECPLPSPHSLLDSNLSIHSRELYESGGKKSTPKKPTERTEDAVTIVEMLYINKPNDQTIRVQTREEKRECTALACLLDIVLLFCILYFLCFVDGVVVDVNVDVTVYCCVVSVVYEFR
uniref:Uncharacterized protein n=1 Tax=Glossina brevipalpis TaxID=37001 RepID=A0A1A9X1Z8_9MUSC